SEGAWKVDNGEIILDSPAYDKRPTFALRRMERGDGDKFDVIVEDKDGHVLTGINVRVTCDGRSIEAGVTQAVDFKVDCVRAPIEVSLGMEMYGLTYQTIDISGKAGVGKT